MPDGSSAGSAAKSRDEPAPRVPGKVVRVLVDDNNRVRKGALLVQLDKQPYQATSGLALAYFEVFSVSAAVAVLLLGFVLLMRRSVEEKGAHIGAE